MNLTEILKKVANGEELTAAEKDFLSKYKSDDENRIPKSRLDAEIQKRKDAEQKASDMEDRISNLEEQLEEKNNGDLSEVEKLKKAHEKELAKRDTQIATLTGERDSASKELGSLKFSSAVSKVAGKHKFSDPEYLGYLVQSKDLNLEDEEAVSAFMKELEGNSPNLFKSEVKPGGGTPPATPPNQGGNKQDRVNELLKKDDLTIQEAAEVADLQEQINSEKS
jgi:hypothetical protein